MIMELKHKYFWLGLVAVFFLSFVTIITLDDYTAIQGRSVQTIAYIQSGNSMGFEIKESGIKNGTIYFNQDVVGGKVIFVSDPTIAFDGRYYSKVKFTAPKVSFSKLDLQLKLSEQELDQIGINRGNIKFYLNGRELPTHFLELKNNYNYYNINSITETGSIVIGEARKVVVPPVEKVADEQIPPEQLPSSVEPETQVPLPLVGEAAAVASEISAWDSVKAFFGSWFK